MNSIKSYSIYIQFTNGQELQFETDTNVELATPIVVNEQLMIVTENEYAFNLRHVQVLKQTKLK